MTHLRHRVRGDASLLELWQGRLPRAAAEITEVDGWMYTLASWPSKCRL